MKQIAITTLWHWNTISQASSMICLCFLLQCIAPILKQVLEPRLTKKNSTSLELTRIMFSFTQAIAPLVDDLPTS